MKFNTTVQMLAISMLFAMAMIISAWFIQDAETQQFVSWWIIAIWWVPFSWLCARQQRKTCCKC